MNASLSARPLLPRIPPWLFAAAVSLHPFIALAQKKGRGAALPDSVANEAVSSDSFTSRPLILILALAAMGLVPFALMMVTSFVKISVVLSIVRSALGTQQIPPTQVITGLAVILTVYIMAPVGQEMYRAAGVDIWSKGPGVFSSETVGTLLGAANKSKEPLRDWLMKKVTNKDRSLFFNLAKKMRKGEDRDAVESTDFMVIIPAFVVSELKEAFQIGFLLFVPFIVIDMVVANILLALGMHMLSPTTISMPFKLLLFVLVDGWYLIAKGLVVGYL
ncbi:type III secretion system export apparatus subunit SctR [Pyxidicoccus xibeiensis]|uniref:type III secretion system export apparatus subunit SctR n=1 Tax=Pyxidicoccus xibeiensis TaxID=2906759 RepID=UPI0020A6EAA9|nr:type III secretion system export apparatus subunit SctR [Pyxidicoccus xibeiensis]MCP3141417.1 type III secretion system export apparatus subunit SctR [Pyxidicoccus xibeiensis]